MPFTDTINWDWMADIHYDAATALTGFVCTHNSFTLTSNRKIWIGAGGCVNGHGMTITVDHGEPLDGIFVLHPTSRIYNLTITGINASATLADGGGAFTNGTCNGVFINCEVNGVRLGDGSGGFGGTGSQAYFHRCRSYVILPSLADVSGGGFMGTAEGDVEFNNCISKPVSSSSNGHIYSFVKKSTGNLLISRSYTKIDSGVEVCGMIGEADGGDYTIERSYGTGTINGGGGFFETIKSSTTDVTLMDTYLASDVGDNVAGLARDIVTKSGFTSRIPITICRTYFSGNASGSGRTLVKTVDHDIDLEYDESFVQDTSEAKLFTQNLGSVFTNSINGGLAAITAIANALPSSGRWNLSWLTGN